MYLAIQWSPHCEVKTLSKHHLTYIPCRLISMLLHPPCKVISHEVRKGMQKWAHPIQESNPLFHLQFQIVFGSPLGHQFCCMVSREALIGLPCVSSDNSEAPITLEQVPCWLGMIRLPALNLCGISPRLYSPTLSSLTLASSDLAWGMGIARKEEIVESLTSKIYPL